MKKTTSKKKSIWKKLFIGLTSIVGIFVVSVCTYFIVWRLMMQPKSGYQPQLTNKEESYFKALETKKGWSNITRLIKNINNKEERILSDTVILSKDYEYLLTIEIEDSATFYSLPVNIEDAVALKLYHHIVCSPLTLRKMTIEFSYVERIAKRLSVGHTLTAIYAIRNKRLIKVKRVME